MISMKSWNQLLKTQWPTIFLFWLMMFAVSITSCDCGNLKAGKGEQPTKPDPKKKLEEEEEDEDEGDGPGVGITNVGNTCYMNSTLQMLKAFYPKLFKDRNDEFSQAGQKMMEALDGGACVGDDIAKSFRQALRKSNNDTWPAVGAQEDAEELLSGIFSKLNFPQATKNFTLKHPVTKEIKASTSSPWNILKINFDHDSKTMQGYIDKELNGEIIDDYKWDDNDLTPTPGIKRYSLLSDLANLKNKVLVIQLIRHEYDSIKAETGKNQSSVKAPLHVTIKGSQVSEKNKSDINYELAGFILHIGSSLNSGHYVSYAKKGGIWYLYNDSNVSTPTEEAVKNAAEQAYIYFYKPVR